MPNVIKPSVGIYTLGCKVSQYEGQAISEAFEIAGFEVLPFDGLCDVYVINTCTVTAESDRKSRQMIRRAAATNPAAIIMVTGCYPQANPDMVKIMPEVDYVSGTENKTALPARALELMEIKKEEIPSKGSSKKPLVEITDISNIPFEPIRISKAPRTRAYVKIEDGCECRCTYCIIPAARGSVRSKAPRDVYDEVAALAAGGCREVVLTGIETASYGRDLVNVTLIDLLEELEDIPNLERIRLGSLDPSLMRDDFINRVARLEKITPHFHLSVQSGSDRILALMKRRYKADTALLSMEKLRARIPGVTFTTDIMVGFPGETDEDFAETMEFCRKAMFLNMHIFAYSKREGTPAAKMQDQVPSSVKKARSVALSALRDKLRDRVIEEQIQSSPRQRVLFETKEGSWFYGHTPNFIEVKVRTDADLHGEIRTVLLERVEEGICLATLFDN